MGTTAPHQIRTIRAEQASSVSPAQAQSAQSKLRLTARGRVVMGILVMLLLVGALALTAIFAASRAQAADGASEQSFAYVVAAPGDSLWSLAAQVAPNADTRDVIVEIMQLNQLQTSDVEIGQELAVPLKYTNQ